MIYIARHGQTDWNIQHKAQGKADIELNEVGKTELMDESNKTINERLQKIQYFCLKRNALFSFFSFIKNGKNN